jgi:alpha-L-fucosidase
MRLFRSKLLYRNKIAIFLLSTLITNVSLSDIHKDAPSIIQRREEPRNFVSFDLGPWMNNKAFGDEADFDGVGTFFSEHSLQSSGMLINYPVNNSTAKGFDHIKINEEITIPLRTTDDYAPIPLGTLYLLVSSTRGPLTAKITVSYTDQTQDSTTLSLPDWQDNLIDQIERYQPVQLPLSNGKKGAMFSTPIYVNPEKTPTQLHLLQGQKTPSEAALHVFSVVGHRATQNKLIITSVQATQEWINAREQVIVVRVHNVGTDYIKNVSLHVSHRQEGGQVKTTKESVIKSIAPGHTYMAHVTIEYSSRLETNQATPVKITAKYIGEKDKITSTVISTNVMIPVFPDSYKATAASVQKHRSPTWLKQAKFGIFIHWGLYSVPAWAPVGKAYAEWYWWRLNQPGDPAFAYHRDMYGEKFEYDQFLEQWKPTQFDARVWLDLIDRSRAKYYVFTTKHHDGIALFDTNVTDRSTTKLLQHNRDFVKELMHTSEQTYPHLKRGLYCRYCCMF